MYSDDTQKMRSDSHQLRPQILHLLPGPLHMAVRVALPLGGGLEPQPRLAQLLLYSKSHGLLRLSTRSFLCGCFGTTRHARSSFTKLHQCKGSCYYNRIILSISVFCLGQTMSALRHTTYAHLNSLRSQCQSDLCHMLQGCLCTLTSMASRVHNGCTRYRVCLLLCVPQPLLQLLEWRGCLPQVARPNRTFLWPRRRVCALVHPHRLLQTVDGYIKLELTAVIK